MSIHLGSLEFSPAVDHTDLLAPPVAEAIRALASSDQIGVVEIDPGLSDTKGFCEQYQIGMDQAANCVILEATRGDKSWFAACVVLGNTRADINGLARRTLDARKLSFAPMEQAVTQSGMEYGAITPIGLPIEWPILIDKAVADTAHVVIGSGIRHSKLAVPGPLLASLPNTTVIEGLARIVA